MHGSNFKAYPDKYHLFVKTNGATLANVYML